jgi:acyl-CoA thioesterase I
MHILQGIPVVTSVLIYVFGSGLAFFIGVGLVLLALWLTPSTSKSRWRPLVRLGGVTGLVIVAASAVPQPWWILIVLACLVFAWNFVERGLVMRPGRRRLVQWTVVVPWLIVTAIELPYQFVPDIQATGRPPLWIVGDSVTAGLGDHKTVLWPTILAKSHGIKVHNRWAMGATVGTALRKLEQEPVGDGIILLEIGGNDLLGSTPLADYEERLDRLLAHVCGAGRIVVMFELPLPPLCNEWGRVQRRLAAQYGVKLVPMRLFVAVLTPDGATVDGIHLTQYGHEMMAQAVGRVLEDVYKN